MENKQGVVIWPGDGSRLVVVLLVLLVVYDELLVRVETTIVNVNCWCSF
jgi:hypothetical protein